MIALDREGNQLPFTLDRPAGSTEGAPILPAL